jgi:hypothetical protein
MSSTDTGIQDTRIAQASGFRRFWYARLLSQTGQGALLYGMLIVLVDQTRSGVWPSLFVITSIAPALLFGLFGGVVADWLPQRFLMIVLNLIRFLTILAIVRGDISLAGIFIVTTLIWLVHQFYSPAESALLPRLVTVDELPRATSRFNLALSVAQLLGMVLLAPLTLKLSSPNVLLLCCAALYLAAGVVLLFVSVPERIQLRAHEPVTAEASLSLRTGWRRIVSDDAAFAALIDSVLIGIGLSTLVVIVPQYLERVLATGADNTVYVFAPAALGVVIGLQFAPLAGLLIGHGRLATTGLVLFALCVLAIGLIGAVSDFLFDRGLLVAWFDRVFGIPPRISTTMLLSLPAGVAIGLVNVAARTVLVLRTPPESHARVFATQMTLANFGALLPTLAAGLLIDVTGVKPVAILISFALVAGAVLGRRIGGDERRSATVRAATP